MGRRIRALKKASTKRAANRCTALSIVLQGEEPPNEFRIFTAGKVETSKGVFTFDDAAAKSVMANYATQGNELMVDYDHASLAGLSLDPAQAGKAAGWFGLEVRAGELWAVNVRWTPPAAEALKRKEWRYMSPAFSTDDEGRVTSVLNVALTNIPATRKLEPLMAASQGGGMSVEEFIKVCKALGIDMTSSMDDAMAKIKGDPDAGTEDAPTPAGDGGADEGTEGAPVAAADAPVPPKSDKPEEVAAALSKVLRLSGKASFVDALTEIEIWHASHVKLETETQKLAAERATLETAERRRLCADLVTKGGKAPAEVWATDKADAPKKYLAAMPIEDFRSFVSDAVKAHAGKGGAVRPPAGAPVTASGPVKTFEFHGKTVTLDAREQRIADEAKCPHETFAMLKARRTATT